VQNDEDPAPTEQEQDETPDGIPESEAMSRHGHGDPEAVDE
jgi:hypothetical protein